MSLADCGNGLAYYVGCMYTVKKNQDTIYCP